MPQEGGFSWWEAPLLAALALGPLAAAHLPLSLQETASVEGLVRALLLGALVWGAFLLRVALPGQPPLAGPRAGWLFLLFPAWSAVTLLYSANRGATVTVTLFWASWAAAAWLAADLAQRGGAPRLLAAVLAGALVVAGMGVQEYLIELRGGNPSWRAFATFTNPNLLAGYLVPAFLLLLSLALRQPESFKGSTWLLVLGLLGAALAAGVTTTGSRGAFLSLGAGLAVFTLLVLLRRDLASAGALPRLAVVLLAAAVGGGALSGALRARQGPGLVVAGSVPLPPELCAKADTGNAGESNAFRALTWRGTLNMARARPLGGWGAGSFESAFAPHTIAAYTRHAHQVYLQLAAEQGLPGLALWLALLAAGLWRAWLTRRDPEAFWAPGAAGALAANAAHNAVDSVIFVPAAGLMVWSLLGLLRGSRPGVPAPGARRAGAGGVDRRLLAAGALGLALLLLHAAGWGLLLQARGQLRTDPAAAQGTLETASVLLPWEPQVALARADAYSVTGPPDRAVEAAREVTRLTPQRPPGYFRLGMLYRYQGDLHKALGTYNIGLEKAPREVELLHARAQVLEELGAPEEAYKDYRRIIELEESPVGQVRALGEMRDYRYARARMALARQAEAARDRATSFRHLKEAACLFAERRLLQDASPAAFFAAGERDLETQRSLRTEEALLWRRLEQEYRRRGENRLADLSAQQAEAVVKSRERLEKVFEELRRGT